MLEMIQHYLAYQGEKYIKPERAASLADDMRTLRHLAQAARKEFEALCQMVADRVQPFEAARVSQWMNQAQICRPHFWCYYRLPSDSIHDVALALRLYGTREDFGISVEVSFVERKKDNTTLSKQHQVLNVSIAPPLYYAVQKNGVSSRLAGTEENRQVLQQQLSSGHIRKVLVKKDIPVVLFQSLEEVTEQLVHAFFELVPYYDETKQS